jgi:hypothetical protein
MKRTSILFLLLAGMLLGCTKSIRPISNSGYVEPSRNAAYCGPQVSDLAIAYRGELNEFDVLGIARGQMTSESEIRRALDQAKQVKLHPGNSILLIQSGAAFPDAPMMAALSKHFQVVPFSGVPSVSAVESRPDYGSGNSESYAKSLRLAAARGGNDFIVCYWGFLESANEDLVSKTVSWVPIPGLTWVLPDERQHMRIRLKLAIVDVRSGNWTVFSPEQFEDTRKSTSPRRAAKDQILVEELKKRAYEAAASDLVQFHSEVASSH